MRNRQIARQRRVNSREVGLGDRLFSGVSQIHACNGDGPGSWFQEPEYHIDGGGLACPIEADKANNFPCGDAKGEAINHGAAVKGFAEFLDEERWLERYDFCQ